jgi:hypothetical protein
MTKTLGRRAIVVGASIAGLMTARVLSEYFDQIVAIDTETILRAGRSFTNRFRKAIIFMPSFRVV